MTTSPGRVDCDTDALVIGGGIVGALIAWQLAEHGLAVSVVDAQAIGSGATRRSAGLVTPSLHRAHRRQTARGVEMLTALARRHSLKARSVSALHVASRHDDADALRGLVSELQADGIDAAWETDPAIVPAGFGGGLRVAGSVMVDPALLATRLLQRPNIVVRQNVEAQKIERGHGRALALAPGYSIRAGAVIVAAGAYAGLLSPYLADAAQIGRGAIWRSRPQAAALPCQSAPVVVDGGRIVAAQTDDLRVSVGAWRWDSRGEGDPVRDARGYLSAHMPDLLAETELWLSSTCVVSRDGGPLVGALSGNDGVSGGVFYALAPGAFGLAWAALIAEQVVDLALRSRRS